MTTPNITPTNFDGIHVSKGFVRGLQGQVLRLEQNQQSLIRQLEHANKLASEYHATAVSWQHKYDQALHKMGETRHALEAENAQWNSASNQIMGMYERERKLRLAREHEMTHLEQLLVEHQHQHQHQHQTETSPSPSPVHTHRDAPREPMSPVSIPSSPRKSATTTSTPATLSAHDNEFVKKQLLIEADTTPFDENDERVVMRDGKMFKQWVQNGFENIPWYGEREMTMSENEEYNEGDNENENETKREFQMRYFYESSASESDYNGDPICHSDSD